MPTLGLGDLSSGALWARRPIRQERKEVSDFLKEARQSSKPGMHTIRKANGETMQIPLCPKTCLKEHRFLRTRVYGKHRSAMADA